jgi:hypothetical protein
MKRVICVVMFFIAISFCSAVPEISLQDNAHQQYETVLGSVEGSLTALNRDSLHVFSGRKEVLFERDVLAYNGVYYFYVIFPSEGIFNIKLGTVLYNDSGNLKSINLEKEITITNNDLNKSEILTIRPGFYYGNSPHISLINSGTLQLNITINKTKIILTPGESRSITIDAANGFSLTKIGSYKTFSVPIIKVGFDSANTSLVNETNPVLKVINLSAQKELVLQSMVNNTQEYFLSVNNYGDSLENITVNTTSKLIRIDPIFSLGVGESTKIRILLNSSFAGFFPENVEFYYNSEKIASTKLQILIFENNNSVKAYNDNLVSQETEPKSCNETGRFLCSQEEACPSVDFSYNLKDGGYCCSIKCVKKNEIGNTKSSSSTFIGLILLIIVLGVGYFLYSRYKKTGSEDKLKEFDKKYQKNISGKV